MNKKLYVVGGSYGYASWITPMGYSLTDSLEESDTLLFTGGSDIGAHLYGHKQLDCTWANQTRDEYEVDIFNKCVGNKSMLGICRGHQFLSAMLGAKIIQDLSHPSPHLVDTIDGKTMRVNSLHHQAVYVPQEMYDKNDCYLFAWANKLSKHYQIADDSVVFPNDYKEVEALFWPHAKALCTQNHPEMMDSASEYVQWIQAQLFLIK